MNSEIDVRHVLPAIRVPTRILHRVDDEDTKLDEGRYLLNRIPGAELVELPGADHGWWVNSDQIVREIKAFLGGLWKSGRWDMVESEQVLATILFTDIVGSTAKLAEVGDRAWGEMLKKHHALVRRHLVRYAGKEMDTAGDGFFARFDGPARAIRCACAIVEGVGDLGLEVRQGLHTGECELVEGEIGGIAVRIGARGRGGGARRGARLQHRARPCGGLRPPVPGAGDRRSEGHTRRVAAIFRRSRLGPDAAISLRLARSSSGARD